MRFTRRLAADCMGYSVGQVVRVRVVMGDIAAVVSGSGSKEGVVLWNLRGV